ncbi:MAG TPA: TonB family protein [Thermoanaerobaculia bacterium]|nr:TonB family protein [Thermoanaerobaculia bacterium]
MRNLAEHPSRSMGFLSRYHDRELADDERLAFERHVADCPECASAVAEYEAILALYRESGTEPADAALAGRISRRIDTELRSRPPVKFLAREIDPLWASVAAIGLVAAIALFAVLGRRPAPALFAENERLAVPRPASPASPEEPRREAVVPGEREAPPSARLRADDRPAYAPEPRESTAPDTAKSREGGVPGGAVGGVEGGVEGGAPVPQAEPQASGGAPRLAESAPAEAVAQTPPQAKSAPAGAPLRVGGDVSAPVLVHRVEPVFPDAVRGRYAAASPILLEAVISETGEVVRVKVLRSSPPFDAAVVAAVRQWRYRPALRAGRPVPVSLVVSVDVDVR